jgi:hypothetical protein
VIGHKELIWSDAPDTEMPDRLIFATALLLICEGACGGAAEILKRF